MDRFELYFYMPFFTPRNHKDEHNRHDGYNGSSHPASLNISSLISDHKQRHQSSCQVLELSHIAISICGVSNHQWTGYAFVDDDESMSEEDFDYTTILPDQFALNGEVDANRPIWDPREYFMRIIPTRLDQIVRRWSWIV